MPTMDPTRENLVANWKQAIIDEQEHIIRRKSLIEKGFIPKNLGDAMISHHESIIEIYRNLIKSRTEPS